MPPKTAMITRTSVTEEAAKTRLANSRRSISASVRAQAVAHEGGQHGEPDEARADDLPAAEAAVAARLGEAVDEQREAGREQREADHVEAMAGLRHVARQDALGRDQRGDPDRQVDEEDPAPGGGVDQPAAEDRAEDRAEQHRDADDRHHAADALRAGGAGQDRHAERHDHAAAEALEDAEADQRLGAPREAREHRAAHEEEDRGQVEALGAEAVGGPAGERDHRGERQRVAGHDPLDGRQRSCRTPRRAC